MESRRWAPRVRKSTSGGQASGERARIERARVSMMNFARRATRRIERPGELRAVGGRMASSGRMEGAGWGGGVAVRRGRGWMGNQGQGAPHPGRIATESSARVTERNGISSVGLGMGSRHGVARGAPGRGPGLRPPRRPSAFQTRSERWWRKSRSRVETNEETRLS